LLLPKIRDMTPAGCFSVTGVDTGVAGTDLLDVGRPAGVGRLLPGVGVTPATAVDSLSPLVQVLLVVNCRPGIGRAGGARISSNNNNQ